MSVFDFSPLHRSTVGFDHVFNVLDRAARLNESPDSHPPYDIVKTGEDTYRITLAVAGFSRDRIEITAERNLLTVTGKGLADEKDVTRLHRGIARNDFARRFQLADHVEVDGAGLADGLLEISLVRRIPEALQPRRIPLTAGDDASAHAVGDRAA